MYLFPGRVENTGAKLQCHFYLHFNVNCTMTLCENCVRTEHQWKEQKLQLLTLWIEVTKSYCFPLEFKGYSPTQQQHPRAFWCTVLIIVAAITIMLSSLKSELPLLPGRSASHYPSG